QVRRRELSRDGLPAPSDRLAIRIAPPQAHVRVQDSDLARYAAGAAPPVEDVDHLVPAVRPGPIHQDLSRLPADAEERLGGVVAADTDHEVRRRSLHL